MSLWALQVRRRAELAEHNAVDRVIGRVAERQDLTGQVTAFATSPGLVAHDATDEGTSPFTLTLLKELASPSVSLWTGLSRTSAAVLQRTRGEQRPFVSSDMNGDLYLSRPSPARACRALLFAAGRFQRMPGIYFEGVYKDIRAWHDFLRARGFDVAEYVNPDHRELRHALEGVRMSLGPTHPALRKVAITLVPDKSGAPAVPPGPAEPSPVTKAAPPKDTLLVVIYSGMGFDRAGHTYLAATDTDPEELERAPAEPLTSAVEVGIVEQLARDRASASVMIYDTMFMRG